MRCANDTLRERRTRGALRRAMNPSSAGTSMTSQSDHNAVWGARAKLAFGVFALIGAFLLIAEHRAHLLPYLPWLFLAACPLMHFFMHGGHGGHHGRDQADAALAPQSDRTSERMSKPSGEQHVTRPPITAATAPAGSSHD